MQTAFLVKISNRTKTALILWKVQ